MDVKLLDTNVVDVIRDLCGRISCDQCVLGENTRAMACEKGGRKDGREMAHFECRLCFSSRLFLPSYTIARG